MTSAQLWFEAYNLHYKGGKDSIEEAKALYARIINDFPESDEATYARKQLDNISGKAGNGDPSNAAPKNEDLSHFDQYFKLLGIDRGCFSSLDERYTELKAKWNPENFISDPEMYKNALKITSEIEEAYKALSQNRNKFKSTPTWYTECHAAVEPKRKNKNDILFRSFIVLIIFSLFTYNMFFSKTAQLKYVVNYKISDGGIKVKSLSIDGRDGKCDTFNFTLPNGDKYDGFARFNNYGRLIEPALMNVYIITSRGAAENARINLCHSSD